MNISSPTFIPFSIDASYPAEFPRGLDLTQINPLSFQTYEEELTISQENCFPYYCVAVVESSPGEQNFKESPAEQALQNENKFYHIYDLPHFATYALNIRKENKELNDPITGTHVEKVYYFAINCFEVLKEDSDKICQEVDFKTTSRKFQLIENEKLDEKDSKLLTDALNTNLLSNHQLHIRRAQHFIGSSIKEGTIFKNLMTNERNNETLLWFWCSAQGSFAGLIKLVKEFLESQNKALFPKRKAGLKEKLEKSLAQWNVQLPIQERAAFGEIRKILTQLNTPCSTQSPRTIRGFIRNSNDKK